MHSDHARAGRASDEYRQRIGSSQARRLTRGPAVLSSARRRIARDAVAGYGGAFVVRTDTIARIDTVAMLPSLKQMQLMGAVAARNLDRITTGEAGVAEAFA